MKKADQGYSGPCWNAWNCGMLRLPRNGAAVGKRAPGRARRLYVALHPPIYTSIASTVHQEAEQRLWPATWVGQLKFPPRT